MKDWVLTAILCVILAVCVRFSNLYLMEGEVIEVRGNLVAVECEGEIFEFYGMGFGEQEKVRMLMDDKDTSDFYDDEIVRVYSLER